MAYQEIAVSSVADIPALVASFANGKGWTASGLSLTRAGGGESFTFGHFIGGTNNQNKNVTITRDADTTKQAVATSPRLNGTSAALPFVPNPTKIHCIAQATPEPFLGVVIEYGYNSYRHLYLGNLEKIGAFTGGEVISASSASNAQSSQNFNTPYEDNQYLFSSRSGWQTAALSGGAHIVHADNPKPWRMFRGVPYGQVSPSENAGYNDDVVMGGYLDGINDGLLSRAKSSYAGASILVPVNLFAVRQGSGATAQYSPIGRPAGVRMVRMDGLDPAQSISVGGKTWKVFPQISKKDSLVQPRGTWWQSYESSYMVGIAYLLD